LALHDGRQLAGERIIDGLHYSIDATDIRRIVEDNIQPSRFFVGNAGWTADQLESEIGSASWLTCPATETVTFGDIPPDRMWIMFTRIATVRAVTPQLSSRIFPADPQLN
jgi:putative transcriptional regulator